MTKTFFVVNVSLLINPGCFRRMNQTVYVVTSTVFRDAYKSRGEDYSEPFVDPIVCANKTIADNELRQILRKRIVEEMNTYSNPPQNYLDYFHVVKSPHPKWEKDVYECKYTIKDDIAENLDKLKSIIEEMSKGDCVPRTFGWEIYETTIIQKDDNEEANEDDNEEANEDDNSGGEADKAETEEKQSKKIKLTQ